MADTEKSTLPPPNTLSTDPSPSPAPSMNSQMSDASLAKDAAATPATTVGSNVSDESKDAGDEKDALGTPRPDKKQPGRFEDDIGQLKAKLELLEKQAEKDRERNKMMQTQLYSGGVPVMGRPSMDIWDYIFNESKKGEDFYPNPEKREEIMAGQPPEKAGPQHVEGRKKVMLSALETELEWIKTEDKIFTNLMKERDELQVESRRLAAQLAQAEEQLRKIALAEEEAKKLAEAEKKQAALEAGEEVDKDRKEEEVQSQEPPAVEVAPVGENVDIVPRPPKHNKPRLNRVEWELFTVQPGILGNRANPEDVSAIDVLEGDPVITFQYLGWRSRMRFERTGPAPRKRQLATGQGPIPERIRINSPHILKILEKIDRDKFGEGDEEGPLVMIRPYKALIYYEDQIRKVYQDLKKKHDPPTEKPEGENATSEGTEETEKDDYAGNDTSKPPEEEEKDPIILELTASAVALEQLGVLIEFLDTDIKNKIAWVRSDQCQRVSFTDIWYLFRLGDEVIDQGRKQAYRVIGISSSAHKVIPPWRNFDSASAKSDETPVILHCVYVDFDGKNLGPVRKTFQIPRFDGEKLINSLDVYPLRMAEGRKVDETKSQTFRRKLIDRGKMFTEVLSVKHMNYNGFTLETRDEVDGQVMIDFEEAFASVEKDKDNKRIRWRPTVQSLIGIELHETSDPKCTAGCCTGERVFKDSYAEEKRNEDYINGLIPEERSREPSVAIYPRALAVIKTPENALIDDDFVIMSYRVFGFILRNRKWAKLDLTYLEYVNKNKRKDGSQAATSKPRETAFDQLVMEKSQKDVILSLTAQHFRDKESAAAANEQVDIVRGKGKGLIILLHGAPGVGKTTTAEGVAELFERPLFQITCGDLGTTAESVEATLETNFSLANRWDCILLLDEADVFLAKRTPQDFIRNGLVSVFLRVLEYYAGILFLTTNRIGDFDEAFGSRIHISLHYPQLELTATEDIFKLNLRLIKQRFAEKKRNLEIEEDLILKSATKYWHEHKKMRWNGRQIRNACQTALALADFEAQGGSHEKIVNADAVVKLTVKHLEVVSAAYLEFMKYLEKLYKTDQDRLAHKRGYRAREMDGKNIRNGTANKTSKELDSTSDEDSDSGEDGTDPTTKDAPSQPSSSVPTIASPPASSAPSYGASPSPAVAQLEAMTAAGREQNPAMMNNGMPGGYMYPNANMGYVQGYPQGFPPGVQPGVPTGAQYGGQMGAQPTQQQQAQMWQNMHPALLQQMMQGQMPQFNQQQFGAQPQHNLGPMPDGSGPPGPRSS